MTLDDNLGIWEERLRTSLGQDYINYHFMTIIKAWESHHANFAHIRLTKKKNSQKGHHFVLKNFRALRGYHEHDYGAFHQPDSLWHREVRNLSNYITLVGQEFSDHFVKSVVTSIRGNSRNLTTIVLPYLRGSNQKKRILNSETDEQRMNHLLDCVKLSAKFNGASNAVSNQFDNVQGFDYRGDAEFLERVSISMYKENLARLVYNTNLNCRTKVHDYNRNQGMMGEEANQYNLESVFFYMKNDMCLDLHSRISEIQEKEKLLHEKIKLQHRDCNGLNMIDGKLLDLEDFGYAPETVDISQNCIVVGLGNNAILRNEQFIYLLQAYLAVEHAYSTKKDPGLGKILESSSNGTFRDYVGDHMISEDYSNFLASFIHRSMIKNIQLGASFSRYTEEFRNESGGHTNSTESVLRELYALARDLIPNELSKCTNPEGVRDLFYTTGHLYRDCGFAIDDYLLDDIKKGSSTASSISIARPNFK